MLKSVAALETPDTDNIPRRYWVWIALFFPVYLVVVFYIIFYTEVWEASQPYAELIIQHSAPVKFFTCILCSGCAWFFLWAREGSRFIGRWGDYVGLAFATFAVQYAFRLFDTDESGQGVFHHVATIVVYTGSALNNLFFFAASRTLLRTSAPRSFRLIKEDPRVLTQLKEKFLNAFSEFRAVVPKWAVFFAIIAQFATFESWWSVPWARYPDALFSLYCLSWFGYAIAVNLNIRRRKVLAVSAMLIALVYGGGQLV